MMNRLLFALAATLLVTPAFAQEPVGCDKFKWNVDKERALLRSPDATKVASGAQIDKPLAGAFKLALVPFAGAKLPMNPERMPKQADSFAGFVKVAALPNAGNYHVTLSEGAWIDVVQHGHYVKSGPFSGAEGCEGIRKSVTFTLPAQPFVVQVSSVKANVIGIVITPTAE
jgi:hypothetical protein